MGTRYNPAIVTGGLVLALDAANIKSYPGSGATWSDLSGYGHNATLFNSPTYANGRLTFDGVNTYATIPSTAALTTTTPTVIVGCTTNSGTVVAKGAYGVYWNYGIVNTTGNSNTTFAARNDSGDTVSPAFSSTINSSMNIYGVAYNGSACVFYRNGSSSGSSSTSYSPNATNSQNITIGCARNNNSSTNVEFYTGSIAFILVYNRALSAVEMSQVYYAMRGRYNI
jgi:predicted nucleic acid-binding Zn ribbon protein